ncbi:MAG: response regulator [Nitrospirales bacterium]|nr:response regulator [Nitrospirales bacterium]
MTYRILIVEDNADIRWVLSDLLESHGYQCEKAPNAITALTMIQAERFDLILTDYYMPRMNGIEFLKQLSTPTEQTTPPVIMITAWPEPDLDKKARQVGARAVLPKPVNADILLLTIAQTIQET